MAKDTVIGSVNGNVSVVSDSNRENPDYLQWYVLPGCMFGIEKNSPALRRRLASALARLERDAQRFKK